MFVISEPFTNYHKQIIAHTKEMMENQNGLMAIHPRFNNLLIALRTAVEIGEGMLDKEATSHDDDCLMNLECLAVLELDNGR